MNIWTGGDAKLFIVFSTLIPLSIYQFGYEYWIPSITLFFNIFMIGFFFIIFKIRKRINLFFFKEFTIDFFNSLRAPKKIYEWIIRILVIYWLIDLLFIFIPTDYIPTTFRLILLYGFMAFSENIKQQFRFFNHFLLIMVFLRIVLDYSFFTIGNLYNTIYLFLFWLLLSGLMNNDALNKLMISTFSKSIRIEDAVSGMNVIDKVEKYKSSGNLDTNKRIDEEFTKKKIGEVREYEGELYLKYPSLSIDKGNLNLEPTGITKKEIERLKKIGFNYLYIGETIPFAPIIFLGVIATIMAKGNILILVVNLF